MRTSIKKITNVLMPLVLLLAMTACNDDDMPRPGFSRAELHAMATSNSGNTPATVGGFIVNDFVVGTHEIQMMYLHADAVEAGVTLENGTSQPNTDAPLGKSISEARELVFASGGALETNMIGEGETPNGIYSEIILTLNKVSAAIVNDVVSGKSFFLAGEWEGTPVHFFLENEEVILAPSRSAAGYDVSGQTSFVLTFNLDKILANVNFDNATDFDQNGIIEIGPNNADANGTIYTLIKNNLASSVEFEVE